VYDAAGDLLQNNNRTGGPGFVFFSSIPDDTRGCPSIRAKALSRKNYPWRCVSIAMFAREVEDEDTPTPASENRACQGPRSGKHLILNHPLVEEVLVLLFAVPPTIDSARPRP
jgi:hypothetical protein